MEPLREISAGNTTIRIGQGSSTEMNLLTEVVNSNFTTLNQLPARTFLGLSAEDQNFFH